MSREEIVGALKTLQDCCKTYRRCENCPLRNEPARCGVTSASPNMCSCYKNGRCLGTKEVEVCSCKGNTSVCDFYPQKRNNKTA